MEKENTKTIDDFRGEYGFLSNFYVGEPFYYAGLPIKSGEHLFNALKTTDLAEATSVLDQPSPGMAKKVGRSVTLKPNWDESERYNAMRTTLGAKFLGDSSLIKKLLATGDTILIEGNQWHDNVWGTCTCTTRVACLKEGENHLGRLLMELREDLRKWS